MTYFERIRFLREEQEISQIDIARMLQVGQRTYSDYERGITRIPVERLMILARFYNVTMDYISGASDQRSPYPLI